MISLAYAALWAFIFAIPWEDIVFISGLGTLTKILGGLALGFALFAPVLTGRLRRWHLFHVAALVFVITSAGVLLFLHRGERLPHKFWTYVQLFTVLWMIWELAPSARRVLGLLMAYVLGAYVAAFGTINAYLRGAGSVRRFTAGGDANDLAMILVVALPMAWYLGMTYRRPLLRWACRAYLPVGVFAVGLTGSRGGMLTGIVALMIVPLTMTKLSPARLTTAIAMLVIAGALAVAYVPDRIVQRLATTGTEVEDLNLGGRFRVWKAGARVFTQRPLLGYGTGSFRAVVAQQLGEVKAAHNSFLSVLVEQGMVGFLLYSMLFLSVFLEVLHLPLLERRFALVLLATLVVAMLPLTSEDAKRVWFVLAALLGLSRAQVVGMARAARQPRPPQPAPTARPRRAARPLEPVIAPGRNAHPREDARA